MSLYVADEIEIPVYDIFDRTIGDQRMCRTRVVDIMVSMKDVCNELNVS